jgi:tetratricopeptide (TPR) repeat protein
LDYFIKIIGGKVMKRYFLIFIVFLVAIFSINIGGYFIGAQSSYTATLSFMLFIAFLFSEFFAWHTHKINTHIRKRVFIDRTSGIASTYDDNILTERLERWNGDRNELSCDKKSVRLNKTIYDLEKKIKRLYTKTKYHDALDLTQQIFQIVKENYDHSHPFFTLTMTNLGKLYQETGNYAEAKSHLEKALEIRQKLLGENHPVVAQSMTNLGILYQEIGKYSGARYYLEKALEVRQELLGENHPVVAQSMTNLGRLYQEIGKYSEAESLFARSLKIKQSFPDKYQIYIAIAYTDFGYLYYEKGEYDKAEEFYNHSMKLWESYFNYHTYPLESAVTVNNLGILYHKIGNYQDAEKYLNNALEKRHKLLGENHPVVAQSMINLGKLYHEMGDYNKAKLLYEKSLNILDFSIGKTNIHYANLLTCLGKLNHDQLDYNEAESHHKQSLEIVENLQEVNKLHIAQSKTNLGNLYHDMGNYREAESYLKKGLEIREKILGASHLHISESKNYLAKVYMNIGDYFKAEEYYNDALEIRLKIFSRFKITPEGLNNLADIHYQLGNKKEAIKLYEKTLKSWKKIGQKKSSGYATALNKIGEFYYDLGDFYKSQEYYNQALEIRQLIFNNDISPPIAQSLNNLGLVYESIHDYVRAEEYYKQALTIWRSAFGDKNINLAITLNNLAGLYAKTNRQEKAIEIIKDVIVIEDQLIGQVFSIASERQRMAFLNIINKNFHNFLSLTSQYFSNSKEEIKYALNLTIRRKGITTEALTATRDAVLSGKYPEMESKLRELHILRMQIARKTLDGKDENETLDKHNQILAEWNNRKENLEAVLANHIPEIGLEQKLKAVTLETIAKLIPAGAVLIEIVKYNFTDYSNQNNIDENHERSRYLAFVIYGNTTNNIQMIDLGDSDLIDNILNKFRNTIVGESQNRNLIPIGFKTNSDISDSALMRILRKDLNPFLNAIGNHKRIFIAPDGDFTKFPFELLPFSSSDRHILEDCLISYITTSRDLITFNNSSTSIKSHNNSLVIADPDFDLSNSEILNNSIQSNSILAYEVPATHSQDNKFKFRQSRDLDPRSLNFNRLKGTREEGQLLAELIGVKPYMDKKVLKSKIKSYTSPTILHIATHGFFLPNQKNLNHTNTTNLDTIETKALARLSGDHQLENPMLRSGLALAGINTWLKNHPMVQEAENGILTAEDVAGWNLYGTKLVVLSACETGLGDIVRGEGVFGLRRAFVLAGAETLVMSLWKVPDEQTKELMVDFYKHLLEGKPRAEALREAQLAMKEKYPNPYFWGAFICQGNPDTLSNLNFASNSDNHNL